MNEHNRAILRVCALASVECQIGKITLHWLTRKNIAGLQIDLMLIEDPKVWGEDD